MSPNRNEQVGNCGSARQVNCNNRREYQRRSLGAERLPETRGGSWAQPLTLRYFTYLRIFRRTYSKLLLKSRF